MRAPCVDGEQVAGWTVDDPELIATFRAEVEERLASLQAGLLQLEASRQPRQAIAGLFRDAHTVKGSARILGLDGVLQLAHTCEDLLGALRDGRFAISGSLVNLLLAACDAIGRAIPGAAHPLADSDLAPLNDVLKRALAGEDDLVAPALEGVEPDVQDDVEDNRKHGSDSVRVSSEKGVRPARHRGRSRAGRATGRADHGQAALDGDRPRQVEQGAQGRDR